MNWERRTAFTLWSVVGISVLADNLLGPGRFFLSCLLAWAGAFLATGLGFWLLGRQSHGEPGRLPWWLALGAQAAAIIASVVYSDRTHLFAGSLLVITAWQAAQVWTLRGALAWCGLQTLALGAAVAHDQPDLRWVSGVFMLGGLQAFAVLAARTARLELKSRLALAQRSSELREVQELLALGSGSGERLKLARELHDGLGHQLTALSLGLETARHQSDGDIRAALERAHGMTREILAALRNLVGRMREPDPVDLEASLRALVEEIRQPRVHLDLKGSAAGLDASVAHALVRCVQEFTTNAIKHAGARNLWLDLSFGPEGARLDVRDDGCGAGKLNEGHGLKGMRERLATLGGDLDLKAGPGGFQAAVRIPSP